MRGRVLILAAAAAGVLGGEAAAQSGRGGTVTVEAGPRSVRSVFVQLNGGARGALGVGTSNSAGVRDTLGLLITSIVPDSPADKAGLQEGNRIGSINGVNLKIAPVDVGDSGMSGLMQRRLTRELGGVEPGDEVDLTVYSDGRTKTVRVKTAEKREAATNFGVFSPSRDRAAIGVSLGSSGSVRDTLGVFITAVNDSGPAAMAGVIEGNRIAAINGVDLRVSIRDAGASDVAGVKVQRLQREVGKLDPGDDVELRIYSNGQFRTVKLKAVPASDLSGEQSIFRIMGRELAVPVSPKSELYLRP